MENVNKEFHVNEFGNVFDNENIFFCKWHELTSQEKEIVLKNPESCQDN